MASKESAVLHRTSVAKISLSIAERIQELRLEILVFSAAYHVLDEEIIDDSEWDRRAKELARLQHQYPEVAAKVVYADAFADFEGDTAAGLPYDDEATVGKARYLLIGRRKKR